MRISVLIFSFCFSVSYTIDVQGQMDYNMSLTAHPGSSCTAGYADVWGFRHSNGSDYGIAGTRCGTDIYDLADPTAPVFLASISGPPGSWRDMKTYGDYVYAMSEQGSIGLQVINMTNPADIQNWNYLPLVGTDTITRAHNIFIDEMGLLYMVGTNLNKGGVLVFDLNQSDSIPPHISTGPALYAHDIYINETRDLMITSDVYSGFFTLHTLTRSLVMDTASISINTVSNQETGYAFTHNAWTSADGNTLFTTDERSNARTESWDITDLDDIKFLDYYLPFGTVGLGVLPHNVHVRGDHIIISHYSAGVKIIDASNPANLVEVGSYATGGSGSNCWGVFPHFMDDKILATDIGSGFYVLSPDYTVAPAYLEGITSNDQGSLLDSVRIQINTFDTIFEYSHDGPYATGIVDQTTLPATDRTASNVVAVTVSKPGYITIDTMITFIPDSTVFVNFRLLEMNLELLNFDIIQLKCTNQIKWEVSTSINHSYFELQWSTDTVDFMTISSLYPTDAQSNTYQVSHSAGIKKRYYRLKQIDLDGGFQHFTILESPACSLNQALVIAPNPVRDIARLQLPTDARSIQVIDNRGQIVYQINQISSQQMHLDLSAYPAGIYYVVTNTDKGPETIRLVKW